MGRFSVYAWISSIATLCILLYAWQTRIQFFPMVVFLSTSKVSIVLLVNFAFVLTLLFGRLLKSLFLGNLRNAELELIYENSRLTITETIIALTNFREQLTIRVFTLFYTS